ncbi:hypothetical protein BDZ88DRAFT_442579 [Geranomyces variabilis]|nr:hypothetical protein BDZ88DRAFT_442579 [Geranomyces variabilis]
METLLRAQNAVHQNIYSRTDNRGVVYIYICNVTDTHNIYKVGFTYNLPECQGGHRTACPDGCMAFYTRCHNPPAIKGKLKAILKLQYKMLGEVVYDILFDVLKHIIISLRNDEEKVMYSSQIYVKGPNSGGFNPKGLNSYIEDTLKDMDNLEDTEDANMDAKNRSPYFTEKPSVPRCCCKPSTCVDGTNKKKSKNVKDMRNGNDINEEDTERFLYCQLPGGRAHVTGPWSAEEMQQFSRALQMVESPIRGGWGLFSCTIPTRVGYQCQGLYKKLCAESNPLVQQYLYAMNSFGAASNPVIPVIQLARNMVADGAFTSLLSWIEYSRYFLAFRWGPIRAVLINWETVVIFIILGGYFKGGESCCEVVHRFEIGKSGDVKCLVGALRNFSR